LLAELRPVVAAASSKPAEPTKSKAELLFQGQLNPKKKKKIVRLEQWVEVRIENGQTVTKLFPSNEKLIKRGQTMWPAPKFVYRRFNFPYGVPEEYAWTCPEGADRNDYAGMGIQRMTVDDWLEMIEEEAERTDGHVGPTLIGNLPRPAEHGECDCPVCTENSHLASVWAK
jgi:hypothetical protein